ncbi:hypothetical protein GPECTOR_7g1259 [Gonium pectorale]|uniref:RNA helicase n=1 Tax=Gonium pectorale TaxID=33097 RepID=A0A150GUD9_GONPE|nr:hypothetical protein GPECTOR_7g1259 [Gonium pectorale]|eukprot:KXZ53363.1 hypothetical protein GPECTOR_7g1259 [Gonium pectorale]
MATPSVLFKATKRTLRCELCSFSTDSLEAIKQHLAGAAHQRALERASPDDIRRLVATALNKPEDSLHSCELCGEWFPEQAGLRAHLRSSRHQVRQYGLLVRQSNLLNADAGGVSVSCLPDPIPPLEVGAQVAYKLTVTNLSGAGVQLRRVFMLQPLDGVSLEDVWGVAAASAAGPLATPPMLPHGSEYDVVVHLRPRFLGLLRGLIVFDLGRCQLVRSLAATCTDAETEEEAAAARAAAAATKRQRKPRKLEPVNKDIVPGEAPPGADTGGKVGALEVAVGRHLVPRDLRRLVEEQRWEELSKRVGGATAASGSVKKWAGRLKQLLWLEELQHEVDVRQYDMSGVNLGAAGTGSRLLVLQVPGLAEKRPSVLKGDRLYVRPAGADSGREWEGVVHVVEREQVLLGFAKSFRGSVWVAGRLFDVRFSVNRSMFNRLQAALSRTASGDLSPLLLLPGSPAAPLPATLPPGLPLNGLSSGLHAVDGPGGGAAVPWVNRDLNDEQRLAVREVVRGAHHPQPYIIFGPPGTGKTSTLVEAAVQLLRASTAHSLLLVAPSNSAADQLFSRLVVAGRPLSEMMRVCAYTRPPSDLPPELEPLRGTAALNWDDSEGAFLLPTKERLTEQRLRVVVATCATAAMLYHVGLPAGRFSHVLLDEAGHAEEPLALAALAGIAGHHTRVVMAGDPKQLGPVILSPFAKRAGLEVSALERLEQLPPFARRDDVQPPHASAFITKLVLNYRSHPDILAVPNAAFYAGELRAAADPLVTHSMLHWEALPNNTCPLLFHNMVGRDAQEASSPSWHNVDEARQVKLYVQSLMSLKRNRPTGADIGVISPYRMQVQRIRAQLAALDRSIKVGSVEEFQGQERKVIIISTVRSSSQHLALDAKHRLGFLANPKRLNVAITRAKALLIIVGNAQILATDPQWCRLLRFIRARGAASGQPLPADLGEDGEDEEGGRVEGGAAAGSSGGAAGELAAALQRLVLSTAADGGGGGVTESQRAALAALDSQLSFLGGALEVEGGEMRRLE